MYDVICEIVVSLSSESFDELINFKISKILDSTVESEKSKAVRN